MIYKNKYEEIQNYYGIILQYDNYTQKYKFYQPINNIYTNFTNHKRQKFTSINTIYTSSHPCTIINNINTESENYYEL